MAYSEDMKPGKLRALLVKLIWLYAFLVVPVMFIGGFFSIPIALAEYVIPTSIEGYYLPKECVPINEAPPSDLMQIVESQIQRHHLILQKIVVCRSIGTIKYVEARDIGLPL